MSIYFNQTNVTPGTAFASGGGGGANPTFGSVTFSLNQPSSGIYTDALGGSFDPYTGSNMVCAYASDTGNLGQIQIANYLEVQDGGNSSSSALNRTRYGLDGITWVSASNVITTTPLVIEQSQGTCSISKLTNINSICPVLTDASGIGFLFSGTATLDSGGVATISLPQAYGTLNFQVLLTQMSGAVTTTPWAKITTLSNFEIAGDSNADISWMTIGR